MTDRFGLRVVFSPRPTPFDMEVFPPRPALYRGVLRARLPEVAHPATNLLPLPRMAVPKPPGPIQTGPVWLPATPKGKVTAALAILGVAQSPSVLIHPFTVVAIRRIASLLGAAWSVPQELSALTP